MENFCVSKFWDLNVTWYTDSPNFTPCFQNTVLVWIPLVYLIVFSVFDIVGGFNSNSKNIPWSSLNILKIVLTVLLVLIQLIEISIYLSLIFVYDESVPPAELYAPVVKLISFVLALTLDQFNKKYGTRSSGILFIFWVLTLLFSIPSFTDAANYSETQVKHVILSLYILEMFYVPCVIGMLLLNCWADLPPTYEKVSVDVGTRQRCPVEEASFLNRVFFYWVEELARKGYRKALQFSDLWNINPEISTKTLNPKFSEYWNAAIAIGQQNRSPKNKDIESKTPSKPKAQINIITVILKMLWPKLLVTVVLKSINSAMTLSSPMILKLVINFIGSDQETWKGYFYAISLFLVAFIGSLALGQYFYKYWMVGLPLRSIAVSAIYAKALRISNAGRDESTVGEIVNLMSVDAQKLTEFALYMNILWSAPLEIGMSLYLLWGILGPSVLAGLGVMLLLIPINGVLSTKVRKLQIQQMKSKDKRIKLINEILSGIKVVKLYGWEPSFQSHVNEIRNCEIEVIKNSAYLYAGMSCIFSTASFLVAVASFASFVLLDGGILNPEIAFVSLTLFNNMRLPLNNFPMVISFLAQASVSMDRINKFLNAEEIDMNAISHDLNQDASISIQNGTFTWDMKSDRPFLRNINLKVKGGSLIAVVGPVGSGKSSLLSAILGEIEKVSGKVNTKGTCAYVSQQAWIQNATLKENVLFGLPLDGSKYQRVIESCALKPDLEILPAGDETEIGERGINLSGGQKQRVSLARAAYNYADIYLLDDPLSAVDSHVGKELFEKVIGPNGILKRKTRVLVTHGITFLPDVDEIIVIANGEISEIGTYKDLLQKKGDFAEFLLQHISSETASDTEDISAIAQDLEKTLGPEVMLQRQISQTSDSGSGSIRKRFISRQFSTLSNDGSIGSGSQTNNKITSDSIRRSRMTVSDKRDKLIEAEAMEMGNVKLAVLYYYIKYVGLVSTIAVLTFFIAYQGFSVGTNGWLTAWSNEPMLNSSDIHGTQVKYLSVYTGLGVVQGICIMIASIYLAKGTLTAAARLHYNLLDHILKAPMSFFDTTPLGRILNRFSKDVDTVDSTLTMILGNWLICCLTVLAALCVVTYTTPTFAIAIIPIAGFYIFAQRFYAATLRQLKRFDSVTRSPIYSHFSETLSGCSTIRAFEAKDRFISEFEARVDKNTSCYFQMICMNRFLTVTMEMTGNLVVLFAAILAVSGAGVIDAGLAGLSISYALQTTLTLSWLLRMTNDVETNLVSVERLKEYGEIAQEADWHTSILTVPNVWPNRGEVVFEDYSTRYRPGLDLVLKNISCRIKPCEMIGIVGRTGAGKSSLTLGLFRIIEAATGRIVIDKLDISKLGLHDIRGRLTVIPQDPVIFSGTLRLNLDPFDNCTDEQIWTALEHAHLKSYVKGLEKGLEHQLTEGGENLSVGQRQLVCLTRALLRKTKILILDEATAAVDLETDALIQQTIRAEFRDCTIITIAHRIHTIMDYTRIMVLDKGVIAEFDTPTNLLQNTNSIFHQMTKDAGII